nr:alpha/beta fold hydrolase [Caulobacter sp. 17J80-11]
MSECATPRSTAGSWSRGVAKSVRGGILKFVAIGAAVVALAYLGVCGWFYANQRSLAYFPDRHDVAPAEVGLTDFQKVAIATPDGETLVGWWKPPAPAKGVVLYLHGNGYNLSTRAERLRDLAEAGFGVLAIDWRGYGGSTGAPSETGLLTDARAAYDWAAGHAQGSKIALFGESLGTGVAVHLAGERPAAGLVLDSPYASIVGVAETYYPFLPSRWLLKDQYRSEEWIGRVRAPVFIVHCDADQQIPLAQARRLYRAAGEPKEMVVRRGCAHIKTWDGAAKAHMLELFGRWTAQPAG